MSETRKILERIAISLEKLVELKTPKQTQSRIKRSAEERLSTLISKWKVFSQDDKWVDEEISRARLWVEANPKRKPKDEPMFLNKWLSRGWERYRKTIPSNKIQQKGDYDFLK